MSPAQLNWKKRILVKLWMMWDQFVLKLLQIEPFDASNLLLKVRIRKYNGQNIPLSNEERIQKGDYIAELHLNNEYLFQLGVQMHSTVQLSIQLIRSMEELLPKLSQYISNHPKSKNIAGVYGISLIHRGVQRFGFTTIKLPQGLNTLLSTMYLRLLLICVHPEGKQRVTNKRENLVPKIIAISKNDLLRRYPIPMGTQP